MDKMGEPKVKLLRQADFKKPPMNRKLLAVVFFGTAIVSLIGMWKGGITGGETLSFAVARNEKEIEVEKKISSIKQIVGQDRVGVYVISDGNENYGVNEKMVLPGGRELQIPVIMAVEKAISRGIMHNEDIYKNVQDKNEIKVEELLAKTKEGDTVAEGVLAKMVGTGAIEAVMKEMGMVEGSWKDNQTTAYDMARMMLWLRQKGIADYDMWIGDTVHNINENESVIILGEKSKQEEILRIF